MCSFVLFEGKIIPKTARKRLTKIPKLTQRLPTISEDHSMTSTHWCCNLCLFIGNYYDYQLSKARRTFGNQVLLSEATGSVASGNLSSFDVISSKARDIARDTTVCIGNEEKHRHFKAKTSSQHFRSALLNW